MINETVLEMQKMRTDIRSLAITLTNAMDVLARVYTGQQSDPEEVSQAFIDAREVLELVGAK